MNECYKKNQRRIEFLFGADRRGLWPLDSTGRAADKLVLGLDNTLGEGSQFLESRGSEIDLVGRAGSTVVNDTDDDRAAADSDLGTLKTGGLLTVLVVGHMNSTDMPAIGSVNMAVAHQVTVASSLYVRWKLVC